MRISLIAAAGLAASALAACGESQPTLAGEWSSAELRLQHDGFDELYVFTLTIGSDEKTGVMDIVYYPTDDPSSERLIRQDLSVTKTQTEITLAGVDPHLVSGPAVVGVYAADTLYCDPLTAQSRNVLTCGWGSDAHGDGPQVRLDRKEG